MFLKTAKEQELIAKREEIIDAEVAVYKSEKMLDANRDIVKLQSQCATDRGQYEHEFHNAMEVKKIELGKLDAQIELKKEKFKDLDNVMTYNYKLRAEVETYKAQAEAKDLVIASQKETIKLLDDSVKVVVGKLSTIDIKSLGLNVTTTPAKG